MDGDEKWFYGFVTLWIVLCAGKPDLLDALIYAISGGAL